MAKRRYDNRVRAERAQQTRTRLLEATTALLVEEGVEALSIPKVAQRADVSAPTAYKNFPTLEDLLLAHLEHVRPQLGLSAAYLAEVNPETVVPMASANCRRFERHGALVRAVLDSSVFQRVRKDSRKDRPGMFEAGFSGIAPRLRARDRTAALGATFIFLTPTPWRWLRDTWGLSARDTAKAVAWAVSVLLRELASDPTSIDPVAHDG